MKQLHITIVTFAWPPRNSIGAHRPWSWAKYWSEAGVQVRVLTAKKFSYDAPLDLSMPTLPKVEVVEVDYSTSSTSLAAWILSSRLGNAARWLYRRLRGKSSVIRNPREQWLDAVMKRLPEFVCDTDVVVSTYDPRMVHQIAAAMKELKPELVWVADYRDLWSLNHASSSAEAQLAREREIELGTVARYADMVSSVSEKLARDQGEFVGKPWLTVTNGFDVDIAEISKAVDRRLVRGFKKLNIVYTGKIYQGFRDPSPLLKVIAEMERSGEIKSGDIVVNIFGGQVDGIEQIIDQGGYSHFVVLHGHVSRDVALEAQRCADLLLLLESPLPEASGVLTGKIFEYMAAGVPILSLGSRRNSAIGSILEKTKMGICTEDDPDLIKKILRDGLHGKGMDWFLPNFDEVSMYSRESQAARLLDEIYSIIEGGVLCARNS